MKLFCVNISFISALSNKKSSPWEVRISDSSMVRHSYYLSLVISCILTVTPRTIQFPKRDRLCGSWFLVIHCSLQMSSLFINFPTSHSDYRSVLSWIQSLLSVMIYIRTLILWSLPLMLIWSVFFNISLHHLFFNYYRLSLIWCRLLLWQ